MKINRRDSFELSLTILKGDYQIVAVLVYPVKYRDRLRLQHRKPFKPEDNATDSQLVPVVYCGNV